jgi:hypothetical protein
VTAPLPRRVEYMPLSKVVDAAVNPKLHDMPGIAASISKHGLGELPLLDERTGRLVAGHGRIDDLRDRFQRGQEPPNGVVAEDDEWLVPVIRGWESTSDDAAAAYLIGSNGLTMSGGWDDGGLGELLSQLHDADPAWLEVTGFNADDMDDLLKLAAAPDLDSLGKNLGEPEESDTWPVLRLKAPPHVVQAWRDHVEEYEGDQVAALAALLDVDPAPRSSGPVWEPDPAAPADVQP